MDNIRCVCSACLEARTEAAIVAEYESHRVTLGVRTSILETATALGLQVPEVCRVLGFADLPSRPAGGA